MLFGALCDLLVWDRLQTGYTQAQDIRGLNGAAHT